jgi:hypothetical protein
LLFEAIRAQPFVPAQAGTQGRLRQPLDMSLWVPAFAGTNGWDAAIRFHWNIL